jgi:uncharacterized protein (TIGR02172 family)
MSASAMPDPTALIGKGYTAEVYAWGEGRVLKLFHTWYAHERAEREFRAARAVHAAGLPAPAAYELVEIAGRTGIVFERLEGRSLFARLQARPWTLFAAVRRFAELHARIHRCDAPDDLPTLRERIAGGISSAGELSDSEKRTALDYLDRLPDGTAMCHGDFHPENVLLTPRGPVIIDWGRASRGHPLGDVACTVRLMRTANLPPWAPPTMHALIKCTRPLIQRTYLNRYLQLHGGTRKEIEAWQSPLAAAAKAWKLPGVPH